MDYQNCDLLRLFSSWKAGDWVYCLHCGMVYQAGDYRLVRGLQMCPYPNCDGDTVFDSFHWEDIQRINPSYPVIPEKNKVYLLYSQEISNSGSK